jgi:heme exporter protein D
MRFSEKHETRQAYGNGNRLCSAQYSYDQPKACTGASVGAFEFDGASEYNYEQFANGGLDYYSYPTPGYYEVLPNQNGTKALEVINTLFDSKYIDLQTRALFIDMTFYNWNVKFFTTLRLLVEFPETGGAFPSTDVRVGRIFEAEGYSNKVELFFQLLTAFIITGFTLYLLFGRVVPFAMRSCMEGGLLKLIWDTHDLGFELYFWAFFTLVQICMYYCYVSFRALAFCSLPAGYNILGDEYIDFRTPLAWRTTGTRVNAVGLFLSWLRLFQFIKYATQTRLWLFILMFCVFCAGSAFAHQIAFGYYVFQYRQYLASFMSVLDALRFQFQTDEISSLFDSVLGPVVALLYALVLLYIMVNLLITIMHALWTRTKRILRGETAELEKRKREARWRAFKTAKSIAELRLDASSDSGDEDRPPARYARCR